MNGLEPRSARRALIVGSARPKLISRLSLSTISVGVFLGAPIPCSTLGSSLCFRLDSCASVKASGLIRRRESRSSAPSSRARSADGRQLQHGRALAFAQPVEQNDLPVGKLKRFVMSVRVVHVNLPEAGHLLRDLPVREKRMTVLNGVSFSKAISVPGSRHRVYGSFYCLRR